MTLSPDQVSALLRQYGDAARMIGEAEVEEECAIARIRFDKAFDPIQQAHFIDRQVRRGVDLLEAMAQTAGVDVAVRPETNGHLHGVLGSIDKVRFLKSATPSTPLWAKAVKRRADGNTFTFDCQVTDAKEEVCAEARITIALVNIE